MNNSDMLTKGSRVSRSLILLPLKLRCVILELPCSRFRPVVILLSLSSSFFKLGSLGNPFKLVKPTLMRLKISRFPNSSFRPTIVVERQLSKLRSVIYEERSVVSCELRLWRVERIFRKGAHLAAVGASVALPAALQRAAESSATWSAVARRAALPNRAPQSRQQRHKQLHSSLCLCCVFEIGRQARVSLCWCACTGAPPPACAARRG